MKTLKNAFTDILSQEAPYPYEVYTPFLLVFEFFKELQKDSTNIPP